MIYITKLKNYLFKYYIQKIKRYSCEIFSKIYLLYI